MVHQKIPILSPVLFASTFVEDESAGVGTFCMRPDTLVIRYNPKFANSNTPETNAFILAHEAAHYLCNHIERRFDMMDFEGKETFDLQLWMLAEEMAVNEIVTGLSGWALPPDCVPVIDQFKGLTTEQIYHELKKGLSNALKKHANGCKQCLDASGGRGAGKGDPSQDLLKAQIQEGATKEMEELQKNGGLPPGNMPGELRELALRFAPLRRPPNWKEMLMRHLIAADSNCKHFDLSTLYKRRLEMDSLCLPNLSSSPSAKRFVVSMDNSGSVSDEMFTCLKGIIQSAATQLGFQEIIVQHFTTQVMVTDRVTTLRQVEHIRRKADGGTALDDCDEKAASHRGQFHIILTDGYVEWLREYSLPTIIVRTVKTTEEPLRCKNLVGSVIADSEEAFG
jgi:predicted metal-dependent peptidase